MCEGTNIPRFLLLLPHIFERLHINAVILSNVNLQVDARGEASALAVESKGLKSRISRKDFADDDARCFAPLSMTLSTKL